MLGSNYVISSELTAIYYNKYNIAESFNSLYILDTYENGNYYLSRFSIEVSTCI